MELFHLTPKQKLTAIICISCSFFIAEIIVALYTGSLAVLADAFHYLTDLTGFVIALIAIILSEKAESPQAFSFGWARARLLGAFFNGVFLFGLGLSILLQSIERFLTIRPVENPKLVLAIGSIGLVLNILSATLLHEHHDHHHGHNHEGHDHDHSHDEEAGDSAVPEGGTLELTVSKRTDPRAHTEHRHTLINLQRPGHDLGMMGVLIHVMGDAVNNVAVIISSLVIWLTNSPHRFYVDPAVSLFIAILIMASSIPLVKNSGSILMESAPHGVLIGDVKHDLERIPGIDSVHELHIWRLDQKKALASAHVVVSSNDVGEFMDLAKTVSECLHEYGVHSVTLQPEYTVQASTRTEPDTPTAIRVPGDGGNSLSESVLGVTGTVTAASTPSADRTGIAGSYINGSVCQIVCGSLCRNLTCCDAAGSLRLRSRGSRSSL
ncbi:cation efflux protein [Xylariaceae sp. FL0594]|nr:cation efflux protein [Xylariaceae sp. FL0594]